MGWGKFQAKFNIRVVFSVFFLYRKPYTAILLLELLVESGQVLFAQIEAPVIGDDRSGIHALSQNRKILFPLTNRKIKPGRRSAGIGFLESGTAHFCSELRGILKNNTFKFH